LLHTTGRSDFEIGKIYSGQPYGTSRGY